MSCKTAKCECGENRLLIKVVPQKYGLFCLIMLFKNVIIRFVLCYNLPEVIQYIVTSR